MSADQQERDKVIERGYEWLRLWDRGSSLAEPVRQLVADLLTALRSTPPEPVEQRLKSLERQRDYWRRRVETLKTRLTRTSNEWLRIFRQMDELPPTPQQEPVAFVSFNKDGLVWVDNDDTIPVGRYALILVPDTEVDDG